MKLKLNVTTIAKLTLEKDETERFVWDDELAGFGLRLRRRRDGGVLRTLIAQYRSDGRTRRYTWPVLEKVAVSKTREAARKILAGAALGYDPAGREAIEARPRRAHLPHCGRCLSRCPSGRIAAKLFAGSAAVSHGHYFRPLYAMSITEITRADLAACLSAVARRHSPTTAAAARVTVFGLFKWAMQEGWLPANPVIGTRKPAGRKPRDRVLTDAELIAIWRVCGDDDFGRIVRLLILLGSRRAEVGGMCWSELDLEKGTWTLPASRSEEPSLSHRHVAPAALAIIRAVRGERATSCSVLFGASIAASRAGGGPRPSLTRGC